MTEPTDAEIDAVTLEVLGYAALDKETNETARDIARAVLAKWGTPQPVVREPLTDGQLWANDEIMSLNADLGWHMDTIRMFARAIERAHGITQKGGGQ